MRQHKCVYIYIQNKIAYVVIFKKTPSSPPSLVGKLGKSHPRWAEILSGENGICSTSLPLAIQIWLVFEWRQFHLPLFVGLFLLAYSALQKPPPWTHPSKKGVFWDREQLPRHRLHEGHFFFTQDACTETGCFYGLLRIVLRVLVSRRNIEQ